VLNKNQERQKLKNELIKRINEQRSSHLMLSVVELLECLIEETRDELETLHGVECLRAQGGVSKIRYILSLFTRDIPTESKFKGLGLS
jgi:hypothetical protein